MTLLLVLACAAITKQKDFDVDLALFEGDSDDAAAPGELPLDFKLYDSRPDWRMPAFLDVSNWGAVMLADRALREAGGDGMLAANVDSFVLDADPGYLVIEFTLSSGDERRFLLKGTPADIAPEACAIRVDEATTAADFSADVVGCLEAWTDANGAPADLQLDALVIDTNLDRYTLAAELTLTTSRPVDTFCSERLVVDDELRAEADNVELNALELAGYAVSASEAMDLVAFENTFPSDTGDPSAGGYTVVQLTGPSGRYVGQEIEVADALPAGVSVSGVEPIAYFPDRAGWQALSIDALEGTAGYVQACWVAAHAAAPNDAIVHFTLVGDGHYDGRDN